MHTLSDLPDTRMASLFFSFFGLGFRVSGCRALSLEGCRALGPKGLGFRGLGFRVGVAQSSRF